MDISILFDLSDLKETRFGQPPPRHGLSLLWWFAHNCVQIDPNSYMTAQCDPRSGAFGFKQFNNRERLLPYTKLRYYKLGNLRTPGLLPKYVTENYKRHSKNSNTDRIIVSFYSKLNRFDKIYVTQHSDQTHFDQNRTYHISVGLMKKIRELSRKDFLRETMNCSEHIDILHSEQSNSSQNISIELIEDNQDLSHEELLREHTDHYVDIPQSEQGETCQNISNELMEDNQDSDQSVFILQSEQHNQTHCQRNKWRYVLLCCSLLVLLLIIATAVYLLLK